MFVLPLLLFYELGVCWMENVLGTPVRSGADAWLRDGLAWIGLTDRWLPPALIVVMLVSWQALGKQRSWRFSGLYVLGMLGESIVYALVLIGTNRLLDLAFTHWEAQGNLLRASVVATRLAPLLGFVGAGIYEEALFRLALLPLTARFFRLLLLPGFVSRVLAVIGTAFLFALAHHAGTPGEPFTWYAFLFRWSAGIIFAGVYLVRGFGIAAGSHVLYDVFVGCFGWQL